MFPARISQLALFIASATALFKQWCMAYRYPRTVSYADLCEDTCVVVSQILHHFFTAAAGFSIEAKGNLEHPVRVRLTKKHKKTTIPADQIYEYHIKHYNPSLVAPSWAGPSDISSFWALVLAIASPPQVRALWCPDTTDNELHAYTKRVMTEEGVRAGPVLIINNDKMEFFWFSAGASGAYCWLDRTSFGVPVDPSVQLAPGRLGHVELLMRGLLKQETWLGVGRGFSGVRVGEKGRVGTRSLDVRCPHPERTWALEVGGEERRGEAVLESPPMSPLTEVGEELVEERRGEEGGRKRKREVEVDGGPDGERAAKRVRWE
ncbi:hypothetical protein EJ05DRAFT_102516 [Pseudovirgaria hyperparasitica]|uniref:Uncharacterized protein n=1 Tax=Pseudovirgaria hyperparasitica TaxID=470096 RepID=A0A6A6VXY3_9PEZI|nr:uncharacterized protein EJ05DRAFT_102516 [Pseudovirgaria hyperparasitica]KAF2755472.1 hypothetical protein EJ05DRAFT_102516 [Pseudovirgaria hyperparasitica]